MLNLLRLLLVSSLLQCFIVNANQDSKIPSEGKVVPLNLIVLAPESIPYHYYNYDDASVVGTSVDEIKSLMQQANLASPTFRIYPWKRALYLANKQPKTLIMPLSRTPERENDYVWLKAMRETYFSVYSLDDAPLTPEIVREKNISIYCENAGIQCLLLSKSGFPEKFIKENHGVSHDNFLDLALAGRIKYFLAEQDLVETGLKQRRLPLNTLKKVYTLNKPVSDYLAISKNNEPELIDLLVQIFSKSAE